MSVTVSGNGGSFATRCTHGEIDQPVVTDASGRFDLAGKVWIFGLVIPQPTLNPYPARYTGRIDGHAMMLTISGLDEQTLGPFMLVYGQSPNVGPCPF